MAHYPSEVFLIGDSIHSLLTFTLPQPTFDECLPSHKTSTIGRAVACLLFIFTCSPYVHITFCPTYPSMFFSAGLNTSSDPPDLMHARSPCPSRLRGKIGKSAFSRRIAYILSKATSHPFSLPDTLFILLQCLSLFFYETRTSGSYDTFLY